MKRSTLLGLALLMTASAVMAGAAGNVETVNPNDLANAPKKFAGKTVQVKDLSLGPDGVTPLDFKEEQSAFTFGYGNNQWFFGKKLNKSGITFIAPKALVDQLRGVMRKHPGKLLEVNVVSKVEQRGDYWVAGISQVEIWAIGARKINPITLKAKASATE
jgi:hypothetical protein